MAKTPVQSAHAHGEHTSPVTYFATFLALCVLMALTVGASFIQLPGFWFISGTAVNNIVAIGIAIAKALLVILIFMNVRHSSNLAKLYVLAGFSTFTLMFIILADYGTRRYEPAPSWSNVADPAVPRTIGTTDHLPNVPINSLNVRPRQ